MPNQNTEINQIKEKVFREDLPIKNANDDGFNRKDYAKNLAEALLKSKYKSSFVVGLYGKWGSGKTSLCNMILEEVKKYAQKLPNTTTQDKDLQKILQEEQIIIFEFNPWLCSDVNQLVNQFFNQLGGIIDENNIIKEDLKDLILAYGDLLSFTKFIPGVGPYLEFFIGAITNGVKNTTEHKDIQKLKTQISNKLSEKHVKLFVTIDDIDRLSEQEIVTVFQLVKALGDFPNTIYFLCFDYDIVTNALNKIHENKGKEYLEKIVQLPVPMPKFKSIELEKIFENSIIKLVNKSDKDQFIEFVGGDRQWKGYKSVMVQYIKSVRDIYRFINIFSLIYKQLSLETYFLDLLGITCLQVFEPVLHSYLTIYKNILFETNENCFEKRQKLFDDLYNNSEITTKKVFAKQLVEKLFPEIISKISNENEAEYCREKRICYKEAFDRYFTFSLHETEISKSFFKNLLCQKDKSTQFYQLESYDNLGKLNDIMEEIFAYYDNSNKNNLLSQGTENLLENFILLLQKKAKTENILSTILLGGNKEYCIKVLLTHIDNATNFLKNLFTNNKISLALIKQLMQIINERDLKVIISEEQNLELEKLFLDQLENNLEKNTRGTELAIKSILSYNILKTQNYVSNFLKYNQFVTLFLDCIVSKREKGWELQLGELYNYLSDKEALRETKKLINDRKFLKYDEKTKSSLAVLYIVMERITSKPDGKKDSYVAFDEVNAELEAIEKRLQQS